MLKKLYFLLGLGILFGMALSPVALTAGPILEGKYFPVVVDVKLTTKAYDEFQTTVTGSFVKVRDECKWKRQEWQYSPPFSPAVDAPIHFQEGTKSRGEGKHDFGPWQVRISPGDELARNSYSYSYHQCHPLWLTRTLFYSSDQE